MKKYVMPEDPKKRFAIGCSLVFSGTLILIVFLIFAIPGLWKSAATIKNNAKETVADKNQYLTYDNNLAALGNDVKLSGFKAEQFVDALPPSLIKERVLSDVQNAKTNVKGFNSGSVKTNFDGDTQNNNDILSQNVTITWSDTYDKSELFIKELLNSPSTYNVISYSKDDNNSNVLKLTAYGLAANQQTTTNNMGDNNKDFVLDINSGSATLPEVIFQRYKGYNSPLTDFNTDITLNLTQINNQYYYNYTVGGKSYPTNGDSEITSYDGQNFVIEVNDNTSNNATSKINLKINNNTDKQVTFTGNTKRLNVIK